jgi:hypothetical protein
MTEMSGSGNNSLTHIRLSRERIQYLIALDRLPRSIVLAEIGVLPFGDLLDRLACIWTEDDPGLLIENVLKRELTDDQQVALLRVLEQLAVDADNLPPRDRQIADRAVYRILHTLPAPLAGPLARRCVGSKRSQQRRAAYRLYKFNGVDPTAVSAMLNDYRRRPYQYILEVIAGDPQAVRRADPEFLLSELESCYWRTRVVQALIQEDRLKAESLAVQYPTEFLWASARERDETTLPQLRRLLDANKKDPEFVRWCLWAFSKLGSQPDVAMARSVAESLIADAPPETWASSGTPNLATRNHAA